IREKATEIKYQGGQIWTPITPIPGSILHAGSQLDAEVLLSELVDQARKGPEQALFHVGPQPAKALRMGLILFVNGRDVESALDR
ncbi:hypothetical protein, partial [Ruegeria intermedia]|uniref:hypothetical protein n=1 Tax=Ruegeria intermedia TaxID=996115 RepID=UPI00165EFB16